MIDAARYRRIDEVFQAALELEPHERQSHISQECSGDELLLKEVEYLLSTEEHEWELLGTPAFEMVAPLLAKDQPELAGGDSVGHYDVVSLLGIGGMGQVYLAEDRKLGRKVALKLLPTGYTRDESRLRRFQQEARAASALNHPNILTIFDILEVQGRQLIVTEYIEGQSLRQRLKRTKLSADESLEISIQVASALSSAHQAGIIHRDIKPENIMLRPDGYVKVLDFGLAKLVEQQEQIPSVALAERLDRSSGLVMGTVKYMSPEQTQGQQVDSRSDIFSLGVVLYEMVAGRAPFEGKTANDLVAAILHKDPPPLTQFLPNAPDQLQRIISKALRKEKEARYRTIDDLLIDLKDLKEGSAALGVAHFIGEMRRRKAVASVAMTLFVIVLAGIPFGLHKHFKKGSTLPFQNLKITQLTSTGGASRAAISPDGKYVAYWRNDAQKSSLWLKQVGRTSETQIVPPAEGRFYPPTFSRDGQNIYYSMVPTGTRLPALFILPLFGGNPTRLPQEHAFTITFSPDGRRFAYLNNLLSGGGVSVVIANADGAGEKTVITRKPPDTFESVGSWSPDGKMIACIGRIAADGFARLIVVNVEDGTEKAITSQKWNLLGEPAWLSDMSGLVMTGMEETSSRQQIWFIPYPGGEARRITNDTHDYESGVSLTNDGRALAITQTNESSQIWTIAIQDESSTPKDTVTLVSDPNLARKISINRDEGLGGLAVTGDGRIVYVSEQTGNNDIWIMDGDGRNHKQLTTDSHEDRSPSVSAGARYIVFISNRTGAEHIWRMDIDGGNQRQLTNGEMERSANISPDGTWVVYNAWVSHTLWKMAIDGTGATQLTETPAFRPRVSPDGKLIAYDYFDEKQSHRLIGVIRSDGGPPIKTFDLTRGNFVRWMPSGQALTFIVARNGIGNIWLQSLAGGEPTQLTDFKSDGIWYYDWSPDGQLLACARGTATSDIVLISDLR